MAVEILHGWLGALAGNWLAESAVLRLEPGSEPEEWVVFRFEVSEGRHVAYAGGCYQRAVWPKACVPVTARCRRTRGNSPTAGLGSPSPGERSRSELLDMESLI